MAVYVWLFLVFVLGAIVGSFVNVCVARLPLEKSILWPGSRCGSCLQRVRWYDNLPLLSYWLLRGQRLPDTVPPDAAPPDLEEWLRPLRERFPPSTPLDDL